MPIPAPHKPSATPRQSLPVTEIARGRARSRGKGGRLPRFDFIDLFAGIGGLRLGFEEQGGRCVFTSEWDKYAVRTYAANFPDGGAVAGDVTKVDAADVPDHDLLLAGFPCQPFSIAGVSKKNSLGREHGFRDATQGTLFFDVARIIDAKRPAAFMLENVKNLTSHDGGRTFRVILHTLEAELGYRVHHRILDARPWLPQNRRRIVIVGFRDPVSFSWDRLRIPARGPRLDSVLHAPDEEPETPYTVRENGVTAAHPKYTLSDRLWRYLQDYAEKHRAKGNGFGCSVAGPQDVARTLSARYHKDGSEILISRGPGLNPRRLTPRECARLMGFDPLRGQPGGRMEIPVSDTQAYRQFGNSVAVPVFRSVAEIIVPHLVGKPRLAPESEGGKTPDSS